MHGMGQLGSIRGARAAWACLLATVVAGCATSGNDVREPPLPAAGIVYESQGEILALAAATIEGREQAFIWERIGGDEWPSASTAVLRISRLDLATRQAIVLEERPSPVPVLLDTCIAVSADGRCAVVERHWDATPPWSSVWVGNGAETWTRVTPSDHRNRISLTWSSDGSALAYTSFKYEDFPRIVSVEKMAIAVPRPTGVGTETVLTLPGHLPLDLEWGASGRRVYLISRPPEGGDDLLEAVDWPALSRQQLMTAGSLAALSVARASGDVIVMGVRDRQSGETADSAPVVVWRLRPDGTVEETAVTLNRLPLAAIVSPNGECLAVAPHAEGSDARHPRSAELVVYQLADGTSQRLDASPSTFYSPPPVHWISGGRALLFQEDEKRVRLAVLEP